MGKANRSLPEQRERVTDWCSRNGINVKTYYYWYSKNNADLVSSGIIHVDEAGKELSRTHNAAIEVITGKQAIFQTYFARKTGHRSYSKIIKKNLILKHPFPAGYFEDFATTYLWLNECSTVVIGDGAGNYRYVQRDGSILNSKLNPKHLYAFKICDEVSKFIETNYPEYKQYNVLLYYGQVVQILNRQRMTDEEFSEIYCRYRNVFRKNLFKVIGLKGIDKRKKAVFASLCLTPEIYKKIRKIFGH